MDNKDPYMMTMGDFKSTFDMLGEDTDALNAVRELIVNGFQAVSRAGEPNGVVVADMDDVYYKHYGVRKLCIIDNGDGMTPDKLINFINKLSAGINTISREGNFGVGAKIAGLRWSPFGLIYTSWVGGKGVRAWLWINPETGNPGFKPWPNGNFWIPVGPEERPRWDDGTFMIGDHGTVVTLLGKNAGSDTMEPPADVAGRKRWILRLANSRFYRIPENVRLFVREDEQRTGFREATGLEPWLVRNATARGLVDLPEAEVIWHALPLDINRKDNHYPSVGNTGTIYQNEVYDLAEGNTAYNRLSLFGVVLGHPRVSILVRPKLLPGKEVKARGSRTNLLINGKALSYDDFGSQFESRFPESLKELEASLQDDTSLDMQQEFNRRIKEGYDELTFKVFNIAKHGAEKFGPGDGAVGVTPTGDVVNPPGGTGGGTGTKPTPTPPNEEKPPVSKAGTSAVKPDGEERAAKAKLLAPPRVQWVSSKDPTSPRATDQMTKTAAKYLDTMHLLLVNADSLLYTSLVASWINKCRPGVDKQVAEVVRFNYGYSLVERVMRMLAMKAKEKWTRDEMREFLSEASLTTAISEVYGMKRSIKETLAQKRLLKKERKATTARLKIKRK